ncbi:hypothetical protein AB9Q10_16240 [Streptomyces krungchingensis]|uniref:hypothetical protein n=1 Tax=Streptomyces krungchingensis TaxID=1565034 RepID=UPI003CF2EA1D
MSARRQIIAALAETAARGRIPTVDDVARAEQVADKHRAEVLLEGVTAIGALPQDYECDPGRGDAAELLRVMAVAGTTGEKSSPPGADATPELRRLRFFAAETDLRHRALRELLASVRLADQPGAWELRNAVLTILNDAPTAYPRTRERRELLLTAMRHERGEWTTGRVKQFYRRLGLAHIYRGTYRRDLAALSRAGHITPHDKPGHRFYSAVPTGKDGA